MIWHPHHPRDWVVQFCIEASLEGRDIWSKCRSLGHDVHGIWLCAWAKSMEQPMSSCNHMIIICNHHWQAASICLDGLFWLLLVEASTQLNLLYNLYALSVWFRDIHSLFRPCRSPFWRMGSQCQMSSCHILPNFLPISPSGRHHWGNDFIGAEKNYNPFAPGNNWIPRTPQHFWALANFHNRQRSFWEFHAWKMHENAIIKAQLK